MVPIWVSEPTGSARPRRISSTPATTVDATAPSPTVRTPSRPAAGAIWRLDVSMKSPVMSRRYIVSMYRIDISQHKGCSRHGARCWARVTTGHRGGCALVETWRLERVSGGVGVLGGADGADGAAQRARLGCRVAAF